MGTYNSGCAKIIVPVLNQDPNGPMLMVSHANTNPGLTKTWDPGEPDKYYPTGKRNYARVVTTDDNQGRAAAQFMAKDLGVKKCYILNDNETYGQGVAKAFEEEATKPGIKVLGNEPWDAKQPNYTALFKKIKGLGARLHLPRRHLRQQRWPARSRTRSPSSATTPTVKLMGPDGFTGYPELNKLPEGQGMYLSFPGLTNDDLQAQGGAAAKLLDDYKAKYGSDPASSYALYGVAAVQVILAAIEKSDGTRKWSPTQVFCGRRASPSRPTSRPSARRSRSTRPPVTSTARHDDRDHQGQRGDHPQGLADHRLSSPDDGKKRRRHIRSGGAHSPARPATFRPILPRSSVEGVAA